MSGCQIRYEADKNIPQKFKDAGYTEAEVENAISKINRYRSGKGLRLIPYERTSNTSLPPCSECGGTEFIRTGTCHACMRCGASQGCS